MEEPLYRDGRHYDIQHTYLTEDIAFYLQQAKQFGPPILELACGTGRITIPLAQQGFEIVGIDISEKMLARAKEKAGNQYPITWHLGDIRSFDLKRKFKLIVFPFNSIAHLHDLSSIGACFKSVKDHLDDEGRFILDIFNPSLLRLINDNATPRLVSEYPDPDSEHQVVITETNRYDRASQINYITWHYQIGDREFTHELNMASFIRRNLMPCCFIMVSRSSRSMAILTNHLLPLNPRGKLLFAKPKGGCYEQTNPVLRLALPDGLVSCLGIFTLCSRCAKESVNCWHLPICSRRPGRHGDLDKDPLHLGSVRQESKVISGNRTNRV